MFTKTLLSTLLAPCKKVIDKLLYKIFQATIRDKNSKKMRIQFFLADSYKKYF